MMRKLKKPAIASEWRENQAAQEKAEAEAIDMQRRVAHEKAVATFVNGMRQGYSRISAVVSLLAACFIGLSLYSYSPLDSGFSVTGSAVISNHGGMVGAWVADFLYWAFGGSAWWLVASFAVIFWLGLLGLVSRGQTANHQGGVLLTVFHGCLLTAASSGLETLQFSYLGGGFPLGAGGKCGQSVALMMTPYLGIWGSTIVFVVLVAVALSGLFRFSWMGVFEKIGAVCEKPLSFGKGVTWPSLRNKIVTEQESVIASLPSESVPATHLEPVIPKNNPASYKKGNQRGLFDNVHDKGCVLPSPELLSKAPTGRSAISQDAIDVTSRLIESKLQTYRVQAKVVSAQAGPVFTQYLLALGDGVKGSNVEGIRTDLSRALASTVRIVPTIPGKPYMGLEVPNAPQQRMTVFLSEIIDSSAYVNSKSHLTFALGKDVVGDPVVADLARMPHLLVGGATGTGKSVAINTMILSLLYKSEPKDLRLVLIDPKSVEFSMYRDIPHLLCPVVTDMNKAANALAWLVQEMDRRYSLMSALNVRSLDSFNEKVRAAAAAGTPILNPLVSPEQGGEREALKPLPYIVCIIDELADLIITNGKQTELHIIRLAQKARAASMHLVLATQRPSVDIVTPMIKTNIVARICFRVASHFDSQVVLDERGAEDLLGRGDMLLKLPGDPVRRLQCCFVSDSEVEKVTEELKKMATPEYLEDVTESMDDAVEDGGDAPGGRRSGENDPLYDEAVRIVLEEQRATTSFVQRRLSVGYNRAANFLEAMEKAGIVSRPNAAGKREILVHNSEF